MLIGNSILEQQLRKYRPDLLFRTNSSGILLGINEPEQPDNNLAPFIYICLGEGEWVLRHGMEAPDVWILGLKKEMERMVSDRKLSPENIGNLLYVSGLSFGVQAKVEYGPAYYIPKKESITADVIEITVNNRIFLEPNFGYTYKYLEFFRPCIAKIVDGKAVAICRTVRRTSLALECGVHCLEEFRNRGFGAEVVDSWGEKVWAEELIPCYSTQQVNKASQALANKLGMIKYATDINFIK